MDIEFPLPDESCRRELWCRAIAPNVPGQSALQFGEIAKQSDGLSGRDIRKAALAAQVAFAPLHATNTKQQIETKVVLDAIDAVKNSKKVFEHNS